MNILALDAATTTGWAVIEDGWPAAMGTINLGRNKRHERALSWCFDMLQESDASYLAVEVPYLSQHRDKRGQVRRNVLAFRVQCEIIGAFKAAAERLEVPVIEIVPAQRLTAIGLAGNLRRDVAKARVMARIRELYGIEAATHDEADAVAIGVAASARLQS